MSLNDKELMPSPQSQSANQQHWINRYRTAPSITPEVLPNAGGTGFIDGKRMSEIEVEAALAKRKVEMEKASTPQDKERLTLLYKAEMSHNGYSLSADLRDDNNTSKGTSKFQAREHLTDLIAYDMKHGHPAITDPKRDLVSEPYTAKEQSQWHRRDGRELTTEEMTKAEGLDWRNPLAFQEPDRAPFPFPEGKWYLHPDNEGKRQAECERDQRERQEEQDILKGRIQPQAPSLDRERIERQRELQRTPERS